MKPQKPDNGAKKPDDKTDPAEIGMTPLMFASQFGSAECVRRLLWAGAEVNANEEDGWTSLHFAAQEGNLEVCTTLLQARADHTMVNAESQTPLDVATAADADSSRSYRPSSRKIEFKEALLKAITAPPWVDLHLP